MFKKVLILFCLILFLGIGTHTISKTIAIRGGEIHTMSGEILEGGVILIKEGKIVEIGADVQIPEDAEVIQAEGFILYPGFIAPYSLLASYGIKNYESFSPDVCVLDRFDFHGDYTRYLAGGVTSVYLATAQNRLVSGKGAIVKLSGKESKSTVVKSGAALNVNFGKSSLFPPPMTIFPAPVSPENPITPSKKQFPSSSLGAFWAIQEIFRFDPYSGDLAKYMENISASLKKAQEKKMPLIMRCQKAVDIYRAVEAAKMLNLPLIIQGGAEAHKLVDLLKKNNVSVIAEAFVRPNGSYSGDKMESEEDAHVCPRNIPALIKAGIPVAICPDSDKYLTDLLWVCQYYKKYGISEEELVKAITINPARMFGVQERIGCLQKGGDADILFFLRERGKSLPELKKVMIEGRIVYEKK